MDRIPQHIRRSNHDREQSIGLGFFQIRILSLNSSGDPSICCWNGYWWVVINMPTWILVSGPLQRSNAKLITHSRSAWGSAPNEDITASLSRFCGQNVNRTVHDVVNRLRSTHWLILANMTSDLVGSLSNMSCDLLAMRLCANKQMPWYQGENYSLSTQTLKKTSEWQAYQCMSRKISVSTLEHIMPHTTSQKLK